MYFDLPPEPPQKPPAKYTPRRSPDIRRPGQSTYTEADQAAKEAALLAAKVAAVQESGRKNMLFGALWFFGGLLVTILSFAAASGGGPYRIFIVAILTGAVQFIYGARQASTR
jgi:hypothetical protein